LRIRAIDAAWASALRFLTAVPDNEPIYQCAVIQ
jgi:hypothetical protein